MLAEDVWIFSSAEFSLALAASRASVLFPAWRAPFSVTTLVSSRASATSVSALRGVRSKEPSIPELLQFTVVVRSSGRHLRGHLDASEMVAWTERAVRRERTTGSGPLREPAHPMLRHLVRY